MSDKGIPIHTQFLLGLSSPFRGIGILRGNFRKLAALTVLPVFVASLVMAAAFLLGVWGASLVDVTGFAPAWLPQWLAAAANWLVCLLLVVMLVAICYLVFTPVGLALASPILDPLSARVERILLKEGYDGLPGLSIPDGVIHATQHLLFTLVVGVPLALLAIFPFIGILFVVPQMVFASLVLSLEFMDFPLSRRIDTYFRKWGFVKRFPAACLAFGGVNLAILAIPIINMALMPLSVIGGTWLYLKLEGRLD